MRIASEHARKAAEALTLHDHAPADLQGYTDEEWRRNRREHFAAVIDRLAVAPAVDEERKRAERLAKALKAIANTDPAPLVHEDRGDTGRLLRFCDAIRDDARSALAGGGAPKCPMCNDEPHPHGGPDCPECGRG